MRRPLAERPSPNDQEDGRGEDRHECVDQADRGADNAECAPEQKPERDTEQESSGDSMVWWRRVQGGNRCSGAAVCQMRSQLSANLGADLIAAYLEGQKFTREKFTGVGIMKKAWVVAFALFGSASVLLRAAPLQVNPSGHKAAAPDVAVAENGDVAILWVDRSANAMAAGNHDRHIAATDVYVATSSGDGDGFSAAVKVNDTAGAVWGQQVSRPRIVATPNGTWHVSYAVNDLHPTHQKTALTTHYTRSTDGGRSFEVARRLSSLTDQDMSGTIHGGFVSAAAFGTMAAARDGSVHVLWIDTRHMHHDSESGSMYAAVSRDDGRSFSVERSIVNSGVCPCCQLMAVTNDRSELLLGSRKVLPGSIRPATVMRLSSASNANPEAISIGGAPWQIAGCPLKPTAVAVAGDRVFAAVHNGGEEKPGVIFSVSKDNAAHFDFKGLVHPEATVSDAPSIASNGKTVLIAWHARVNGPRHVFYRYYNLDGAARGDVQELPTGANAAQAPVLAVRSDGNYQIVWQQGDDIFTDTLAGQ